MYSWRENSCKTKPHSKNFKTKTIQVVVSEYGLIQVIILSAMGKYFWFHFVCSNDAMHCCKDDTQVKLSMWIRCAMIIPKTKSFKLAKLGIPREGERERLSKSLWNAENYTKCTKS